MLKQTLALCGAGLLSFSTPLYAATTPSVPLIAATEIETPPLAQTAPTVTTVVTLPPIKPQQIQQIETKIIINDDETECIARAIYFEARGEPTQGQTAVGYVVLNRTKYGRWAPTPCKVIAQYKQFSWYHPSKVIPTKAKTFYLTLAKSIVSTYSRANDPTGGATFFHANYVHPGWRDVTRLMQIGHHIFYSLKNR